MNKEISILADYREKRSGVPDLLKKTGLKVDLCELKSGDYFINRQILIERKTKEDFVQTLISKRLFNQCRGLKLSCDFPLFIIEGNPFITTHNINPRAIRGAILSVSVSWQIPVLFSADKNETAGIIKIITKQNIKEKIPLSRPGYKPKRKRGRKLYFIQGLPAVGPALALRLLDRFGSIQRLINASHEELLEIEGIGKKKAKLIIDFIHESENNSLNSINI